MKKNKMKKTKMKLSIYFAILTTITIVTTSILFAIYLYLNVNNLLGRYQASVEKMSSTLSMVIAQSLTIDIEEEDFSSSEKIIDMLKLEGRVAYVYVRNVVTNKIVIGDQKRFIADTTTKQTKVKQFSRQLTPEYTIYGGIPVENLDINMYDSFSKLIIQIIFIFIILGAVVSYLMSNVVSEPLSKLSSAAKQITDGNFDIKIDESQFDEINDLVYSYNEMATQLNELYSSLELKVQERTIALEAANYKLKEAQAMMVHSEKMRSLGELVAGIAHEINNPVNFIHGNIMILQNYADDLIGLIDLYSEYDAKLPEDFKAKVESLKQDIDLDFLRGDIKDLIRSCIEGTQRTKNIVLDLKNFSRMEEMVLTQFDIPKEIDTTLNILNNKYKNRITVVKNYSPNVPKIEAYGGQLNQVFMNILDNAQDAMAETGTLTINIDKLDDKVKIEFIDTGAGIPPENLKKVFDPFFTTKPVGKGTGLGMSISYRVIHDHQGTIDVDSEVGKGTKFTIVLPINHAQKTTDDIVEDLKDGVNS